MGFISILYKIWICIVIVTLILPIILQYILNWKIFNKKDNYLDNYSFSVYAVYLTVYLIVQFILAYLNNKGYNIIKSKNENGNGNGNGNESKLVNIIIVGYKEKPEYFKKCLESIKVSYYNSKNINKIIVVIDGNDDDDIYMIDIFNNIFTESSINILLKDFDKNDFITNHFSNFEKNKSICISQNHNGKRTAMFTGFSTSLMYNKNVKYVFCTDSDTIIKPDCIENMITCFQKNKNIGSVCGNLSIFNKYDSFITFLSHLRYWYAFNLERAYQSFTGEVLCVSGPIGMYDINIIEKVIEEWKNQTFLGKKCTYGDDRHLTNKILESSKKVIYTQNSIAETETPDNIYRFFKQQVRWNKSAFREFFWTLRIVDKHSIFMTINIIYMFFYPYLVIGYLLYILWVGNIFQFGFCSTLLLGIGLVKSIYGYILSKNPENLLYFLYGIVYVCIVFPAKLWSIINIYDNSWGTSSRKILNQDISIDILAIIIWNVILISGLIKNIYGSIHSQGFDNFYYFIISSGLWILFSGFTFIYIKYKNNTNLTIIL
jgi:hyaluronan synthase